MFLRWEASRSHKAQDESADRHTQPEARRDYSRREVRAVADSEHENDDPTAYADFCADVEEQEDRC